VQPINVTNSRQNNTSMHVSVWSGHVTYNWDDTSKMRSRADNILVGKVKVG